MERMVISLGGSVIVPDKFDIEYLKKFRKLIASFIKKGYKFRFMQLATELLHKSLMLMREHKKNIRVMMRVTV